MSSSYFLDSSYAYLLNNEFFNAFLCKSEFLLTRFEGEELVPLLDGEELASRLGA